MVLSAGEGKKKAADRMILTGFLGLEHVERKKKGGEHALFIYVFPSWGSRSGKKATDRIG